MVRWNESLGLWGLIALYVAIMLSADGSYFLIKWLGTLSGWWVMQASFGLKDVVLALGPGATFASLMYTDRQQKRQAEALRASGKDRTMI